MAANRATLRQRGGSFPVAVFVAPLVGTFPFAAVAAFSAAMANSGGALAVLFLWVFAYIAALLVTLTLGVAWHAFALQRNWRGFWLYAGAGALLGGLIIMVLWLAAAAVFGGLYGGGFLAAAFNSAIGAFTGTITAAAFWWLRRPDRDLNRDVAPLFD